MDNAGPDPKVVAAAPLEGAAFARLMAALEPPIDAPALALAVSGGGDSGALLCLAADWARPRGVRLLVLTVDHGLRPDTAREAEIVRRQASVRGLAHETLVWEGPKPSANIEAEAREARYRLLAAACRRHGLTDCLLGHTEDDQAETLLLRLARGSGLKGLAAMAPGVTIEGVRFRRPLLTIGRDTLRATLMARGEGWLEDPSNTSAQFARSRLRRLMPALAAEGLTAQTLAETARRLARAQAAIDAAVEALADAAVRFAPEGFARLDPEPLRAAPEEVALRLLADMLCRVGGAAFPPRLERLERLYAALTDATPAGAERCGRTLAGCRIVPATGAFARAAPTLPLLIFREARALAPPLSLKPGTAALWDRRFHVALSGTGEDRFSVGGLGAGGLATLRRLTATRTSLALLPAAIAATVPALWRADALISVPALGLMPTETGHGTLTFETRFITS